MLEDKENYEELKADVAKKKKYRSRRERVCVYSIV